MDVRRIPKRNLDWRPRWYRAFIVCAEKVFLTLGNISVRKVLKGRLDLFLWLESSAYFKRALLIWLSCYAGSLEEWRRRKQVEKRNNLVSINNHKSQSRSHRAPSREPLLWFVEWVLCSESNRLTSYSPHFTINTALCLIQECALYCNWLVKGWGHPKLCKRK